MGKRGRYKGQNTQSAIRPLCQSMWSLRVLSFNLPMLCNEKRFESLIPGVVVSRGISTPCHARC